MNNLQTSINHYLMYCQSQKRLDYKTLKAYRIDLRQFSESVPCISPEEITPLILENHIADLHQYYKPKTVKRKIASVKSFLHYLEYKGIIEHNPFNKVLIKFREPILLPKTIPLHTIETLLTTVYCQRFNARTDYQRKNALKDAAIIELLFATGIRVSELCSLKLNDVDLFDGNIRIYGKGSKERIVQLGNNDVIQILKEYKNCFKPEHQTCGYFFVNQNGSPLSDQSIRRIINKYTDLCSIDLHITPHMFRHTFATSLLEADVDIRYIQEMLGHSSINVTEIYTHVTTSKQRAILATKHPRNSLHF